MRFRTLLLATLLTNGVCATACVAAELTTVAERSGFTRTGRYQEVIELCAEFQRAYPEAVRCIEFGRTPEGRPMLALIASTSGALDVLQARQRKLPVLLVQGGIHAGEIDGKDAGFLALREVLDGKAAKGVLDKQVLLFVPVFNVDGHERFGAWSRPNQRGPEAMGWRTTAQNYNLNRDYAKADSAEMQAMLRLVNDWDPIATIDLHVTNGAKFEHDIAIMVEPLHAGDAGLRKAGLKFRDAVLADLSTQGSLPLPFYPSFTDYADPTSGFVDSVAPPRFSSGYFLLRNRFGMLVETHSWKDYPTRVRSTRNTVIAVLEHVAEHGEHWLQLAAAADSAATQLAGKSVALEYAATAATREIDFRGYAYTRTPSAISGSLVTRYDESKPQIWKVGLRDQIEVSRSVTAPAAGYLVPAAHAGWVAERLDRHGIDYRRIDTASTQLQVQTFRASKTTPATQSVEGHMQMTLEGEWKDERRDLAAGALFVPIAQAKAHLLMALLEPQAPDSLAAWGEFNNAFEAKEYMEAYVAEEVAEAMLAKDPALAKAFSKRLAEDKEFAASPGLRLEFFHRLHPSWDEQFNLYPVLRATTVPE
ncbi:MAG: M14 family metallopeptidase [Pseudomarimonas sp.]